VTYCLKKVTHQPFKILLPGLSHNLVCANLDRFLLLITMRKIPATCFLFFLLLSATGFIGFTPGDVIPGYDLSSPVSRVVLPPILHEISGLTETGPSTFACIQDENGKLFIVNTEKNEIEREISFGLDGDYEGITRVGETIYVLRSDGLLYEIPDYRSGSKQTIYHDTHIPAANNEGLCYDSKNNRLLIGCKGRVSKEQEEKDRRLIYAFDLKTKKLGATPAYDFNVNEITAFAVSNKVISAFRENKKGRMVSNILKFSTSEIAIHPRNKLLYVLCSADHLLMVFDENGTIKHMQALDPVIFNKPEGITFFPDGDMLITNEGQKNVPTLLRFKYKE